MRSTRSRLAAVATPMLAVLAFGTAAHATTPPDDSAMLEPSGPACGSVPADGEGSFAGMADDPAATAASNNPELSTLVTAVDAAGLVDTLNGEGPFTIFAPANSAFEAIPAADLEAVLADPTGALTDILTFHVVAGEQLSSTDLAEAGTVEGLGGELTFAAEGDSLTINGGQATVVCADVPTANATVHIIDGVLMPESGEAAPATSAPDSSAPTESSAPAETDGVDDEYRWLYVDSAGEIVAQSGGFDMVAAYPVLDNTAEAGQPDNSLRANGNVYIDAGEDLATDAIVATLTLQNTVDVDGNGMAGRTDGPDTNDEFSGQITVSACNTGAPDQATGPTNCAPPDAQNGTSFVVSPRLSDGQPTTDDNRKGFYVIILGD